MRKADEQGGDLQGLCTTKYNEVNMDCNRTNCMDCKFGGQSDGCSFDEESYNQALEDFKRELIKIYHKRYMHDIYLDDVDNIAKRLHK